MTITFIPKINNTNHHKQKSKNQHSVFQRLYALSQKLKYQQVQPIATFQPVINARSKNLVRDGRIQEMLYGDALRRQEKGNELMNTVTSTNDKDEKVVNYNNQKYAATKFIRQYYFTLNNLNIDTSFKNTIDYVTFNQLLKKMGFVSNDQQQHRKTITNQRVLIHDAYQLLQKTRVNARNICVFMLGLLGIYHISPINFQQGQILQQQKQLNLTDIQGRRLQKQYEIFYRNRLSTQINRRIEQKNQKYIFQPIINKYSNQLAKKYRDNMQEQIKQLIQQYPQYENIKPSNQGRSHQQLLILNKIYKDKQKLRKIQENQVKELQFCTFKPNTSSLNNSKIDGSLTNAGLKKSVELYQYHKQVNSKKQSLKASRQQYDPQCTFKPLINKSKPPKIPNFPKNKHIEQTIYRMYKGRKESQEKKQFLSRGQKSKYKKSSDKTNIKYPILTLDINIKNCIYKLDIFEDDQQKLQQICNQFCIKYMLDQDNKKKLLSMIKGQFNKIYQNCQENQEDQH